MSLLERLLSIGPVRKALWGLWYPFLTRRLRDEDVLFLTLSSHGDQDIVQLSNPPLEMDNLEAAWLREALDASGIRWRVIVVSSCYSGSFIDELSSPTTVVITASAADKMSFGCTNSAEMTYFGQAFFAESLRENTSFEAAFKAASLRVGEREGFMGFEPSEPQMIVGSLMKTALPAFERVLFDKSRSTIELINEGSELNNTAFGSMAVTIAPASINADAESNTP